MKRLICLILIALLLSGCAAGDIARGFYYPRTGEALADSRDHALIAPEMQEIPRGEPELAYLLQQYLDGPQDPGFYSPFPEDIRVLGVTTENSTLILELSDSFCQLQGIQLTLAQGGLAATCRELTGLEQLVILSAGERYLIHYKDFIFLDPDPGKDGKDVS